MQTPHEWARVYYGDGTTFDHGDPLEAPGRDVQVIAVDDADHRWRMITGGDYYVHCSRVGWRSVDIFGLYDYLLEPGARKVLFGRTMPEIEWQQVLARVHDEQGEKLAYRRGERRPS